MYKIGYRTVKTAVGTAASVTISHALGLNYFTSSGIITVLCVQNTRRKSIKSAFSRFSACNLSMLFAGALFSLLGYHTWVIGLFLLLFIPLTVHLKIQEGVVTSSVIMFHIFLARDFSLSLIWNEFQIILIGVGVALLANLYMPNLERGLKDYQERIERNFKVILLESVHYLRHQEEIGTGKELQDTKRLLKQAKILAFQSVENDLIHGEDWYYGYFNVRDKQLSVLEKMLHLSSSIEGAKKQRYIIARYLEMLALCVNSGNTSQTFIDELNNMRDHLNTLPLPTTRRDFEDRAYLFQFLNEVELYLNIKKEWKRHTNDDYNWKKLFG